jgi:hypothetical protein
MIVDDLVTASVILLSILRRQIPRSQKCKNGYGKILTAAVRCAAAVPIKERT